MSRVNTFFTGRAFSTHVMSGTFYGIFRHSTADSLAWITLYGIESSYCCLSLSHAGNTIAPHLAVSIDCNLED